MKRTPRDPDDLFKRLGRSPFRQRFRLRGTERDYLDRKGLGVVLEHGRDFIAKRLAPAQPSNDGKQAQGRALTDEERRCVPDVLRRRRYSQVGEYSGERLRRFSRRSTP